MTDADVAEFTRQPRIPQRGVEGRQAPSGALLIEGFRTGLDPAPHRRQEEPAPADPALSGLGDGLEEARVAGLERLCEAGVAASGRDQAPPDVRGGGEGDGQGVPGRSLADLEAEELVDAVAPRDLEEARLGGEAILAWRNRAMASVRRAPSEVSAIPA